MKERYIVGKSKGVTWLGEWRGKGGRKKLHAEICWGEKRDSRAEQGMIVGEEEIERKVEKEVWTHRGALHFDVRISFSGCQYTNNTHSH